MVKRFSFSPGAVVRLFVPVEVVKAHLESFHAKGSPQPLLAILFYFLVPVAVGLASWLWEWRFIQGGVAQGLLAAVALVGSVFVAVSAVVIQGAITEAGHEGFATEGDRRRIISMRN